MSRSSWKKKFVANKILKYKKFRDLSETPTHFATLQTKNRNSSILKTFVGIKGLIYNGKEYKLIKFTKLMVGQKFGEFHNTREMPEHKKK